VAGTSITINGVDVTAYIDIDAGPDAGNTSGHGSTSAGSGGTFEVIESPAQSQFTFQCDLVIPTPGEIPVPQVGSTISWTSPAGLEFAGIIQQVQPETQDTTGQMRYTLMATDYTGQFDRHLVVEEWVQDTPADQMVKYIIDTFVNANAPAGVKFTYTNVQAAPPVAARKINYQQPSAVMTQLCNELQWAWYIDYERDVHFAPVESAASPLAGNVLNADTDLVDYGDLTLNWDASQVRNRIYVLGFLVMSNATVTDDFVGDGTTTTFSLSQIPAPISWSSTYDIVTVGGIVYSNATDVASALPGYGNPDTAYFNKMNQTVRFATAPGADVAVHVTYRYLYAPITMVEDPVAQAWWAKITGDDGVYEYMVNDNTLSGPDTSLAEAQAQLLLAKYAYPAMTGEFVSYTQGWRAGQSFRMNSAVRMGGISNKLFYVLQNTKTIVDGTGRVMHDLQISDRPYAF